ncbi:MAG: NIPSNAP family protein [Dehalococcoidia bacterium]
MIYVLEEMTVRPGMLREYQEAFSREYVPGAEARGMRLVGSWTTPPVEMEGESSDLVVLWSLADVDAFWKARTTAGRDPKVLAWWRKAEEYQVRRSRRFLQASPFSPMS